MSEYEAKQVLQKAGIPVVREEQAGSAAKAVEHADRIGYPVIMKVDSSDIQHKTDINAVMEARDGDEVRKRYDLLMETVHRHDPNAEVEGVLIDEKVSGHELIVGVNRDPDFGHVVMFGLGGIFVEVLHDVHFRALPLTHDDAKDLIGEMETGALLDGVRGQPPADRPAIIDVLLHVSQLVEDHPEIRELDINPLFVSDQGAVAADALITAGDGS